MRFGNTNKSLLKQKQRALCTALLEKHWLFIFLVFVWTFYQTFISVAETHEILWLKFQQQYRVEGTLSF